VEEPPVTPYDLLERVRAALGRRPDQPPAPAPPPRIVVPEVEMEERVARFLAAVEALAGSTHRAADAAEAGEYVARAINGRRAIASGSPFLRECGITGSEPCATAEVGITSADYALADTGTLVLFSSPEEARMISLLPPAHIAVVPKDRVLTGLDELFAREPLPGERSSSMVLITGPSRTADIEQILVRGVHGPGELHVVIVG
jgi:L-lactate dehydrogenase complex protein LldG